VDGIRSGTKIKDVEQNFIPMPAKAGRKETCPAFGGGLGTKVQTPVTA
jgi:hypothetical protein